MRHLTAADYVTTPWKNGGGETTQIMIWPPDATLYTFAWRISRAAVASDGPFSHFPGIDRTLAVIAGNGLDLNVDGVGYRLTSDREPLAFSGEAATFARLVDGPIADLNVMVRRGVASSSVTILRPGAVHESHGQAFLAFAQEASIVECDGSSIALAKGDTLVLEHSMTVDVTAGVVIAIDIKTAARTVV